jgi:hypothetical protein
VEPVDELRVRGARQILAADDAAIEQTVGLRGVGGVEDRSDTARKLRLEGSSINHHLIDVVGCLDGANV